jgi:hypothetical protein
MKYITYISIFYFVCLCIVGCKFSDVEDFNGTLRGAIYDANQNIVPGDIMSNTLVVKVLGEGDITPITIRVKGDGRYQNTNLFPKKYSVWLEGPIVPITAFDVDLTKGYVEKNIVVTPYLSISNEIIGPVLATSVKVKYKITANTNSVPVKREIYCSTLTYPTANSGSGPYYSSQKVAITNDEGEATITGLTANTKYYIRMGANISGKE